jgi:hypothetical protein
MTDGLRSGLLQILEYLSSEVSCHGILPKWVVYSKSDGIYCILIWCLLNGCNDLTYFNLFVGEKVWSVQTSLALYTILWWDLKASLTKSNIGRDSIEQIVLQCFPSVLKMRVTFLSLFYGHSRAVTQWIIQMLSDHKMYMYFTYSYFFDFVNLFSNTYEKFLCGM